MGMVDFVQTVLFLESHLLLFLLQLFIQGLKPRRIGGYHGGAPQPLYRANSDPSLAGTSTMKHH